MKGRKSERRKEKERKQDRKDERMTQKKKKQVAHSLQVIHLYLKPFQKRKSYHHCATERTHQILSLLDVIRFFLCVQSKVAKMRILIPSLQKTIQGVK